MARRPLASRPLDLIYFSFFIIHIPASLLVDFQALYPASVVPKLIRSIIPLYITSSGDPLIAGAFNFTGTSTHSFAWFRSFLWLEFLFQFPVWVLGARALWKDSPSIYLLLLVYGASTATTTLPCLVTMLVAPTTSDAAIAFKTGAVTSSQRIMLLSGYVPFLLIPLVMTLDMAWRLSKMLDFKRHTRGDHIARIKREE